MKSLLRILPLLLLLGTTALLVTGCGDHHGHGHYDAYYITIVNDTPWDVYVEPFGFLLAPGDSVDADVGYDVIRVVAIRHFDGLVLADVHMASGDVLIIQ
jgi:hypothetical protein